MHTNTISFKDRVLLVILYRGPTISYGEYGLFCDVLYHIVRCPLTCYTFSNSEHGLPIMCYTISHGDRESLVVVIACQWNADRMYTCIIQIPIESILEFTFSVLTYSILNLH